MTVLVITSRADTTADFVVNTMNVSGMSLLRLDFAEFPLTAGMTARFDGRMWAGRLSTAAARNVQLDQLTGIYYRRPTNPVLPPGMTVAEQEFATREIRLGYGGLLAALPERLWVNHPRRLAAAEASKPWQLQLAAKSGLLVPRTLITVDPDEAAEFVDGMGTAALKPFGNGGFSDEDGYRIAYARRVTASDVRDESIRLTAHQLQEWIDAEFAVRMITVDHHCFAVAIHPGSEKAQIDWRSDYDSLAYERIDPPAAVRNGINVLHAELGLRFSASDFLVDHGGSWWFLETNPNGQWAWIECVTDEISSAIATALTEGVAS